MWWKKTESESADSALIGLAQSEAQLFKELILLPRDPKSAAFRQALDEAAHQIADHEDDDRRIRKVEKDISECVKKFSQHQQLAVDRIIGQLDESLREILCTLDEAVFISEEVAEAAQTASRRLIYLDQAETLDDLKSIVKQEISRLQSAVKRHTEMATSVHEKYKTELEALHAHLNEAQQAARTDALTKLPNRTALEYFLNAVIAKAKDGQPYAAAMLDLNGFKEINDTLGHGAGDAALVHFSQCLRESMGSEGFVARLAGDEFTVVYKGTATNLLGRLEFFEKRLTKEACKYGDKTFTLSASYGVAEVDGTTSYSVLMKEIDERMYAAKRKKKYLDAAS